jgi:CBS domain-containing protein
MGIINTQSLAEMMFIPVIPEEYIDDPQGYEQALKYSDPSKIQVAAEIMGDPIFVHPDDKLENAFHMMREQNLPGLPIVDKHYHVTGFVSLLDLMSACFLTSN